MIEYIISAQPTTRITSPWDIVGNLCRCSVNDRLSKTFVRTLPYGTVWIDEPSPFYVVSGVAKCDCQWVSAKK